MPAAGCSRRLAPRRCRRAADPRRPGLLSSPSPRPPAPHADRSSAPCRPRPSRWIFPSAFWQVTRRRVPANPPIKRSPNARGAAHGRAATLPGWGASSGRQAEAVSRSRRLSEGCGRAVGRLWIISLAFWQVTRRRVTCQYTHRKITRRAGCHTGADQPGRQLNKERPNRAATQQGAARRARRVVRMVRSASAPRHQLDSASRTATSSENSAMASRSGPAGTRVASAAPIGPPQALPSATSRPAVQSTGATTT